MKKIVSVLLSIMCIAILVACQTKTIVADKNGNVLEINKKDYIEYDFSKMSNTERKEAFNRCFDLSYKYQGLPDIVLDNTNITNTLKNSGFGGLFVSEFCETHKPYIIYNLHVVLKNGCLIDSKNRFNAKLFNMTTEQYNQQYGIGQGNGTDITLQLRCNSMPTEKTKEAWNRTVNNLDRYKNAIDYTIDDLKRDLKGIDVNSINGIIYMAK